MIVASIIAIALLLAFLGVNMYVYATTNKDREVHIMMSLATIYVIAVLVQWCARQSKGY